MDANADMCSTCRFPAKTSNGMLSVSKGVRTNLLYQQTARTARKRPTATGLNEARTVGAGRRHGAAVFKAAVSALLLVMVPPIRAQSVTTTGTSTATSTINGKIDCDPESGYLVIDHATLKECEMQMELLEEILTGCAVHDSTKYGTTGSLACYENGDNMDGTYRLYGGGADNAAKLASCKSKATAIANLVDEYTEFPGVTYKIGCSFGAMFVTGGTSCAHAAVNLNAAVDYQKNGTGFRACEMECNRDLDIGIDITFCYITGENDCNKQVEQINDLLDRSDCASYWGSTTKTPLTCQVVDADSYPDKFTWGTAVQSHCARLIGVMQLITEEITEDPSFPGDEFELGCIFGKLYIKSADETEYTAYQEALNELITKQKLGTFHGCESSSATTSVTSSASTTGTTSGTTTATTMTYGKFECETFAGNNFVVLPTALSCDQHMDAMNEIFGRSDCQAKYALDSTHKINECNQFDAGNPDRGMKFTSNTLCNEFAVAVEKMTKEITQFDGGNHGEVYNFGCTFSHLKITGDCAEPLKALNELADRHANGTFFGVNFIGVRGAKACEHHMNEMNELFARADCKESFTADVITECSDAGGSFDGSFLALKFASQASCLTTAAAIKIATKEITQETINFPGTDYTYSCFQSLLTVTGSCDGPAAAFNKVVERHAVDEYYGCEVTSPSTTQTSTVTSSATSSASSTVTSTQSTTVTSSVTSSRTSTQTSSATSSQSSTVTSSVSSTATSSQTSSMTSSVSSTDTTSQTSTASTSVTSSATSSQTSSATTSQSTTVSTTVTTFTDGVLECLDGANMVVAPNLGACNRMKNILNDLMQREECQERFGFTRQTRNDLVCSQVSNGRFSLGCETHTGCKESAAIFVDIVAGHDYPRPTPDFKLDCLAQQWYMQSGNDDCTAFVALLNPLITLQSQGEFHGCYVSTDTTTQTSSLTSSATTSHSSTATTSQSTSATSSATTSQSSSATTSQTTSATTTQTTTPTSTVTTKVHGKIYCDANAAVPLLNILGQGDCEDHIAIINSLMQSDECKAKFGSSLGKIQCQNTASGVYSMYASGHSTCSDTAAALVALTKAITRFEGFKNADYSLGCFAGTGLTPDSSNGCTPFSSSATSSATTSQTSTVTTEVVGHLFCEQFASRYYIAVHPDRDCTDQVTALTWMLRECGSDSTATAECNKVAGYQIVGNQADCQTAADTLESGIFQYTGPGTPYTAEIQCASSRYWYIDGSTCDETVEYLNNMIEEYHAETLQHCDVTTASSTVTSSVTSSLTSTDTTSQTSTVTSSVTSSATSSATSSFTSTASSTVSTTVTSSATSSQSTTETSTQSNSRSTTVTSTATSSASSTATSTVSSSLTTSASSSATTSASSSATTSATTSATSTVTTNAFGKFVCEFRTSLTYVFLQAGSKCGPQLEKIEGMLSACGNYDGSVECSEVNGLPFLGAKGADCGKAATGLSSIVEEFTGPNPHHKLKNSVKCDMYGNFYASTPDGTGFASYAECETTVSHLNRVHNDFVSGFPGLIYIDETNDCDDTMASLNAIFGRDDCKSEYPVTTPLTCSRLTGTKTVYTLYDGSDSNDSCLKTAAALQKLVKSVDYTETPLGCAFQSIYVKTGTTAQKARFAEMLNKVIDLQMNGELRDCDVFEVAAPMSAEDVYAFSIKVQNEANLFLRLEKVPTRIMCTTASQVTLGRRRRQLLAQKYYIDVAMEAYPNSDVSSYAEAVAVLKEKVNEGSFVVTDKDGNPIKSDTYEETDDGAYPTKSTTLTTTLTTTATTTVTTGVFGKVECIAENGPGKWLLGIAAGSKCDSQLETLNDILEGCPKDHGTLKCDAVTNGVVTFQVLADFGGLSSCTKTAAAMSNMLSEFTGPVRPVETTITCSSFHSLTNPSGTTAAPVATNPGDTTTTTTTDPLAPTTASKGECAGKLLGSVVFNVVGAFMLTAEQHNEMGENAKSEASRLILGANIPTAIVCQRSLFGGNRGLPDGLVVELVANTFSSDQANDKASELVEETVRNNLFNIPVAGSPWPLTAENFVYEGQPFITTMTTTTVNVSTVDPADAAAEQAALDEAEERENRTTLIIACVSVAAVLCIIFAGIVMMEKRASEGTSLDLYSPGMQGNGMLVNGASNYAKANDFGDFGGVSDFLMGMGKNPAPDAMSAGYVDVRPEFRANSPAPTHFFPGSSGFDAGPSAMSLVGLGGGGGGMGGSQYRPASQFSQYRLPQARPTSPGVATNRSSHYFPAADFTGGMFGNTSPGHNLRTPPGLSPGGDGVGVAWGQVPEPFIMGDIGQATAVSNNGAWSQSVQPESEWTVLGANRNAAFNDMM
eukprot:gene1933-17315_t